MAVEQHAPPRNDDAATNSLHDAATNSLHDAATNSLHDAANKVELLHTHNHNQLIT